MLEESQKVQYIDVRSEIVGSWTSEAFAEDWRRYSFQEVLAHYREPSDISIGFVPPIEPGALPYYDLWLVYEQQGFYVAYMGLAAYEPPIIRACPQFTDVIMIAIHLQQPKPGERMRGLPTFTRSLEEVTGMDWRNLL